MDFHTVSHGYRIPSHPSPLGAMGSQILRVLFFNPRKHGSNGIEEQPVDSLQRGRADSPPWPRQNNAFEPDPYRRVENEAQFFPSLSPLSLRRLLYEHR